MKFSREKLINSNHDVKKVTNIPIPEVELDEIDLEAIKELEKAKKKNNFITLEEHLRST